MRPPVETAGSFPRPPGLRGQRARSLSHSSNEKPAAGSRTREKDQKLVLSGKRATHRDRGSSDTQSPGNPLTQGSPSPLASRLRPSPSLARLPRGLVQTPQLSRD